VSVPKYVELHCHSAYSFLDGASLPEELAARAVELGYEALALTDHDGVYGSLEFAHAAHALGLRAITGAEATLADGSHVTLLVETPRGYANLCRLLTAAHAHERLNPRLDPDLLAERTEGLVCLSGCARRGLAVRDPNAAERLARAFGPDRFFVELQRPYERGDARRNAALRSLAETLGVRTVATGDVHAHHPRRTRLQDVLVAVRNRTSLEGCEAERRGNRESVLLPPAEVAARFPHDRAALETAAELAGRLAFDLTQELGYRYPDFSDREDPADVQLARVCAHAFEERYRHAPHTLRRRAEERLREELALIAELGLSGFFLLHWEVLELAREVAAEVRGPGSPRHLLPPGRGRGSSVGSIVCYLTGLSHVDPVDAGLALGRFLNRELRSVPDIDLDFPRDIREKLIVAVTERYGREHSALVASFATYRARGAIRDVGKALGLPQAELERLARVSEGWNARKVGEEMELVPGAERRLHSARWRAFRELCGEIAGLPRHLSQHPGGMVVSSRPLVELVPVEPAAMEGRQNCQWDKDSCADAGFLKIDLLGLGMLSAVGSAWSRSRSCAGGRSTCRGFRSTTRASTARSRTPTPWGSSRSRAARRCRASCARVPRTSTTSPSRSPSCARGRSRGRRCTRTSSGGSGCARIPPTSRPTTIPRWRSRCGTRSARSSSRSRCSTSRWPWRGSPWARPRASGAR
jgi:error-prone DNA polymerase